MSRPIYLDYNSTTKPYDEVIEAVTNSMKSHWENPSTLYDAGRQAKATIEEARRHVAALFNVPETTIIFTSGGTESNHMTFHSIVKEFSSNSFKPHVITCNIEHDNVLRTLKTLEDEGRLELTVVPVSHSHGVVEVTDIMNAVRFGQTKLISIMLANNETGAIFPVHEIVTSLWEKYGSQFTPENRIYVHTDGCQAVGKIPIDLSVLKVDYLSLAAHKFHGPRWGALYVRNHMISDVDSLQKAPIHPVFCGGKQEFTLRPGTEHTALIVGTGKAAQIIRLAIESDICEILRKREHFESKLRAKFHAGQCGGLKLLIFGVDICSTKNFTDATADRRLCGKLREGYPYLDHHRLPNTSNICFQGPPWINSFVLFEKCKTLQATRGAACSAGIKKDMINNGPVGSPVLVNCGYSPELAATALRLSIGKFTTLEELDMAVECIHSSVLECIKHAQK